MWGPWSPNLDDGERLRRTSVLRALAFAYTGNSALEAALSRPERDADALADAQIELDLLPALPRRRLLSTYARLSRPR